MSVSTINAFTGPYIPNGVTTAFPFTFTVGNADDLAVVIDGVTVNPVLYTTVVNAGGEGGTVTFLAAPTGDELFVALDPDFTQAATFVNSGPFLADVVEDTYDRAAIRDQYLKGGLNRTMRVAMGKAGYVAMPGDEGGVFGLDDDGNGTVYDAETFRGPPGTIEVSGLEFVTPQQFGAVSGGSAAVNGAAFEAAIAYLKASAVNDEGFYKGSVPLLIPPGDYSLDRTLEITHQVRIEGIGGTANAAQAVILRWPANTTGIRIQYYNTSGAGDVGASHYSGASAHLKGLRLVGGYTNFASEGEYHGIHAKAAVVIEDCFIRDFQGDGIFSRATAGGGAPNEGNANVLNVSRVRVDNCRNGVYLDGADTNAGLFQALNLNGNRQWGVWDSSFLGNTYIGCHAAGNGQSAAGMTPTQASQGGNRYSPVFGQEAGAATNAPSGTTADNTWWYYYAPGGVDAARSIPAWSNGMALRNGGAYMMEQAFNVMVGCYAEQDQGVVQIQAQSVALGGDLATGVKGFGSYIRNAGNYTTVDKLQVMLDTVFYGQAQSNSFWNFYGPTLYNGKISSNDGTRALIIDGQQYISLTIGSGFVGNILAGGIDLAAGKTISINAQQVVGARGAAVADPAAITSVNATNAAAAPTQAEFNAFVAEFNKLRTDFTSVRTQQVALLARLRAATGHGLIA